MLSVKLPKHITLSNVRLAVFHFGMVAVLLVVLTYINFIVGDEHVLKIPASTSVTISWNETQTVAGMENFLAESAAWQAQCDDIQRMGEQQRWGYTWDTGLICTTLCKLDDLFLHASWSTLSTEREACWSDFKKFGLGQKYTALQFMENAGQRDLYLITAKNDWVVNHMEQTRRHYIEAVPQVKAASIEFGYFYSFAQQAMWFFGDGQDGVNMRGDNTNAKTVILGADGAPVGEPIPPGGPLRFTVDEVMSWAHRSNGDSGPVELQHLIAGAEINMQASCFGSDADLNGELIRAGARGRTGYTFGATLEEPVCLLSFNVVSSEYSVNVEYSTPAGQANDFATEVMSETTGFYFKVVPGAGAASVYDINTILLNITSMLVIISLPQHITSFVAVRMLGPISEMYRRNIMEPYDLEAQTSGAACVLASNAGVFDALKRCGDNGTEIIDLPAIHAVIQKTMASRASILDAREIASMSNFLYEDIRRRRVKAGEDEGGSCMDGIFDISVGAGFFGNGTSEADETEGISLDQWNLARMQGERVTFDALVRLFDKDRHRCFLERFFTPPHIRKALLRAMDAVERHRYETHHAEALVDAASQKLGKFCSRVGHTVDEKVHHGHPTHTIARLTKRGTDIIEELIHHSQHVVPEYQTGTSEGKHHTSMGGQDLGLHDDVMVRHSDGGSHWASMLADLRRKLDHLHEHLLVAERGVLRVPSGSHSVGPAGDLGDAGSGSPGAAAGHRDGGSGHSVDPRVSNGSEVQDLRDPASTHRTPLSNLDEVEKRLADVESSLQALQYRGDLEPPVDDRRPCSSCAAASINWDTAVIESLGELLPSSSLRFPTPSSSATSAT